jgi:hypothetical protein
MKKSLFYSLLTTATLLSPIFAFPSWAKDCPEIPKDIKVITVKSDDATLRIEPDKDSDKGFSILANDNLKILDHKSIVDKTGKDFCWYKVSAVKDTTKKPYFIADVGIKEFPFVEKLTLSPTPSPTTSTKSSPSTSPTSEQGKPEQNGVIQQNWLLYILVVISIGNTIILIILLFVCLEVFGIREYLKIPSLLSSAFKHFGKNSRETSSDVPATEHSETVKPESTKELSLSTKEEVSEMETFTVSEPTIEDKDLKSELPLIKEKLDTLDTITEQVKLIKTENQENKKDIQFLTRKVENLEDNQQQTSRRVKSLEDNQQKASSSGNQGNALTHHSNNNEMSQDKSGLEKVESHAPEIPRSSSQESSDPSERDQISSEVSPVSIAISPQLQEIIDRFNQQSSDLFCDSTFQPLTLTQDTINGTNKISGGRILQLEVPIDQSQAPYLRFEMDNASWLIPNITSIYIKKILSNLDENSDIFTIRQGSGSSLKLIRPAKLKAVSSGLWEIEEPGEFQQ